jgi:ketosteroid isomerase-like protein
MTNDEHGISQAQCPQSKASRRAIKALWAALPLSVLVSPNGAAAADAVADLVKRAEEKNAAFIRGDMDGWSKLVRMAPDFTLMQPFGGPVSHGFDASPKRLAKLSQYFKNGEATLELSQSYASDGLVVLVMIERQRIEVGGLPAQDWSLRVTEVYRKDGSEWQLVHRHADPLVRKINLQHAAVLARGWPDEKP